MLTVEQQKRVCTRLLERVGFDANAVWSDALVEWMSLDLSESLSPEDAFCLGFVTGAYVYATDDGDDGDRDTSDLPLLTGAA